MAERAVAPGRVGTSDRAKDYAAGITGRKFRRSGKPNARREAGVEPGRSVD